VCGFEFRPNAAYCITFEITISKELLALLLIPLFYGPLLLIQQEIFLLKKTAKILAVQCLGGKGSFIWKLPFL
jgi:hypothetical protein